MLLFHTLALLCLLPLLALCAEDYYKVTATTGPHGVYSLLLTHFPSYSG